MKTSLWKTLSGNEESSYRLGKIFTKDISDKRLLSKIYKGLSKQLNNEGYGYGSSGRGLARYVQGPGLSPQQYTHHTHTTHHMHHTHPNTHTHTNTPHTQTHTPHAPHTHTHTHHTHHTHPNTHTQTHHTHKHTHHTHTQNTHTPPNTHTTHTQTHYTQTHTPHTHTHTHTKWILMYRVWVILDVGSLVVRNGPFVGGHVGNMEGCVYMCSWT
jgi:hypothetical protein